MRRTLMAAGALALGSMALSSASFAGGREDWVCWMQPHGVTACASMPDPYHVRDVTWKPHQHKDWASCRHCAVDFKLTHRNIDDLGRKTDNSTMRAYHDATLYGKKYRGPYDHD